MRDPACRSPPTIRRVWRVRVPIGTLTLRSRWLPCWPPNDIPRVPGQTPPPVCSWLCSLSSPLRNVAPARTRATRCGALTFRQRHRQHPLCALTHNLIQQRPTVAIAAAVDVVGHPLAAVDYREHRRTFPDLAHSRGSLIRTPVSGISSGKVRPFPEAHPQVLIIPPPEAERSSQWPPKELRACSTPFQSDPAEGAATPGAQ
jgi:hypothetical protein